jgi:hypothetical protein
MISFKGCKCTVQCVCGQTHHLPHKWSASIGATEWYLKCFVASRLASTPGTFDTLCIHISCIVYSCFYGQNRQPDRLWLTTPIRRQTPST